MSDDEHLIEPARPSTGPGTPVSPDPYPSGVYSTLSYPSGPYAPAHSATSSPPGPAAESAADTGHEGTPVSTDTPDQVRASGPRPAHGDAAHGDAAHGDTHGAPNRDTATHGAPTHRTPTHRAPTHGAWPGDERAAGVVARLGDIVVTADTVHTPVGDTPRAGSTWQVDDEWVEVRQIPTWAMVCAVVGFFAVAALSLLFLLARETVMARAVRVAVTGGHIRYETRIPVTDDDQVQRIKELVRSVSTP